MDEGRKRTILIAASILVSRKFAELGGKSSPALESAVADAISMAEKIMQRIDRRSAPSPPMNSSSIIRGGTGLGKETSSLRQLPQGFLGDRLSQHAQEKAYQEEVA